MVSQLVNSATKKKKINVVLGPFHLRDFQSVNLFYFADNSGLPVWWENSWSHTYSLTSH